MITDIFIEKKKYKRKKPGKGLQFIFYVQCDECGKRKKHLVSRIELTAKRIGPDLKRLTFCSSQCLQKSRKNGALRKKTKETCLKRYGETNGLIKGLKDYTKRMGVENVSQIPEVKKKINTTNLERYGNNCPMQNHAIHDKILSDRKEKYGVEWPFQRENVKQKAVETNRANLGCDWPMQSTQVQSKSIETNLKNRNCEWPSQSLEVKAKIDYESNSVKRHETMKKNGTYGKATLPEKLCYVALYQIYGQWPIYNCLVNSYWPIDFYIEKIDVYVQVDGVYWHGLDRSIDEIKESNNIRDQSILKSLESEKDIRQNQWFEQQNMCLVRFTDTEIKSWRKNGTLKEHITNKIKERKQENDRFRSNQA